MTFEQYTALPGINATALKAGAKSMKHMRAVMTGKAKPPTPAMIWGTLVHAAVLEPQVLFAKLAVWEGRRAGREWDAFKADNDPAWIVSKDDQAALMRISAAVHANPDAHRLIEGTTHEATLEWAGDGYGLAKARLDGCDLKAGVLEVKTTADVTERAFAAQFVRLGYDIQSAWYAEGMKYAHGAKRVPVHVVCIEADEPYDVAVYRVPKVAMDAGREKALAIARRYRECEAEGVFPGVQDGGAAELTMPGWYQLCGDLDTIMPVEEMNPSELGA